MNLFSILSFTAFIVYLYLGVYAYRIDSKSLVNRLFLLLCISFAIWSFSYAFIYPASSKSTIFIWNKISSLGWCSYYGIILHLTFVSRFMELVNVKLVV